MGKRSRPDHAPKPGPAADDLASANRRVPAPDDTRQEPVAEGVPPFPWSLFWSLTTPAGAKWAHDLEKLQERDFEEVLAEELEESSRETESPRFSTHIPQRRPHAGAAAQATRALGEGVQASPKGSLTSRGCTPGLQPRDLNVAINRGGPASSAGPPLGSATSP